MSHSNKVSQSPVLHVSPPSCVHVCMYTHTPPLSIPIWRWCRNAPKCGRMWALARGLTSWFPLSGGDPSSSPRRKRFVQWEGNARRGDAPLCLAGSTRQRPIERLGKTWGRRDLGATWGDDPRATQIELIFPLQIEKNSPEIRAIHSHHQSHFNLLSQP